MALSKSITLKSGVETTYHKVGVIRVDPKEGQVCIDVEHHLSQATRSAGKPKVSVGYVVLPIEDVLPVADLPVSFWSGAVYGALKADPLFDGATDVLE